VLQLDANNGDTLASLGDALLEVYHARISRNIVDTNPSNRDILVRAENALTLACQIELSPESLYNLACLCALQQPPKLDKALQCMQVYKSKMGAEWDPHEVHSDADFAAIRQPLLAGLQQ